MKKNACKNTDNATYALNRPKGQFSKNISDFINMDKSQKTNFHWIVPKGDSFL